MAKRKKRICYDRTFPSGQTKRICRKNTKPRRTAKVKRLQACVRKTVKQLKASGTPHERHNPLVAQAARYCGPGEGLAETILSVPPVAPEPTPPWYERIGFGSQYGRPNRNEFGWNSPYYGEDD